MSRKKQKWASFIRGETGYQLWTKKEREKKTSEGERDIAAGGRGRVDRMTGVGLKNRRQKKEPVRASQRKRENIRSQDLMQARRKEQYTKETAPSLSREARELQPKEKKWSSARGRPIGEGTCTVDQGGTGPLILLGDRPAITLPR